MDMSKYKEMFISETKEHLNSMNRLITSLEKDPSNREDMDALFREAHSVKGMAASMGYDYIADLSHKMEDMMDLVRKGEVTLDPSAVDLLYEGLDALEAMVKGIEDDAPCNEDRSSLLDRLASIGKDGPPAEVGDARSAGEGGGEKGSSAAEDALVVDVEISRSAQMPGTRAFLVYKRLEDLGRVLTVEPPLESVKKGDFDNRMTIRLSTDHGPGGIEEVLRSMVDLAGYGVKKASEEGEENIEREEEGKRKEDAGGPERPARRGKQVRTVRVSTDLLDNLINIVGEMIIAKSRLAEAGKDIDSAPLRDAQAVMGNLIRDLHDQVMTVRMTPLRNLMERMPRVVRDLARKSGKKVDLEIEGKDIELDRAIVDEMGDPLVHILRNCVDHGIEPPGERKEKGKPLTGRILMRAMRERDQVIINIEDDGRGMDAGKIRMKAVEKGLIKESQARAMSDREAFMLVCHSGLSTAEKVTEVSGRGVGMDAVKNVVDTIGGSLDIDSVPGRGTNITIKLPLTVAIVQVLLIRVGGEVFAVPINKIIKTLEVSKGELRRSQKQLAVFDEDELVPLLSLKKMLGMERPESPAPLISIVVIEMKKRRVGIVVDALIGQQEAFIKPLEPPLGWIKGFSGATILGDGSVAFVLDVPNLL